MSANRGQFHDPELNVIQAQAIARAIVKISSATRPCSARALEPDTVKLAPRRRIATSNAVSIWRRFFYSSGPQRLDKRRLSTGLKLTSRLVING